MKFNEKTAAKIYNKLLKSNRKKSADPRMPRNTWSADGFTIIGDQFRIYRLTVCPHGISYEITYTPDSTKAGLQQSYHTTVDRVYKSYLSRKEFKIDKPTTECLKSLIAEFKAESKGKAIPAYDFGPDLPQVNAEYLLDILEMFPDAEIYVDSERPLNSALMIYGYYGDAVLMPLYKKGK